jgi:hypothetical protein
MIQGVREARAHRAPIRRRRPAPPAVARIERDDRVANAEFFPAESVIMFGVVARVSQHGVEAQQPSGLAQRRRELRRVLSRPGAGHRTDDQVRAEVNNGRELGPRATPVRRRLRHPAADAEVETDVVGLESGGIDRRDRRAVKQARSPGPHEDGALRAAKGAPFSASASSRRSA